MNLKQHIKMNYTISDSTGDVGKIAKQVLHDPIMMQWLSDRVYALMLEDLRNQKERIHNYGKRE